MFTFDWRKFIYSYLDNFTNGCVLLCISMFVSYIGALVGVLMEGKRMVFGIGLPYVYNVCSLVNKSNPLTLPHHFFMQMRFPRVYSSLQMQSDILLSSMDRGRSGRG